MKNYPIKAIVAESETLLRKSICDILSGKSYGYTVFEAKDGLEVIEILKEHDIDMLIINTILPKVSGKDIISLIRKAERKEREKVTNNYSVSFCETQFKAPEIKYIYIITMLESSSSDEHTVSEIVQIGSDDFIFKPFSIELLRSKFNAADRIIKLQKEIQSIYKTIYELSTIDILTKVWNRRTIINKLYKQICLSIRERKSLAVFMIDIDHFKRINDEYGHLFGDRVLEKTASALKQCCRTYDEIGRYGGEEFLLITPLYSNNIEEVNYREGKKQREQIVKQIANRILNTVREKGKNIGGKDVNVTVSVGAAILDFTPYKNKNQQEINQVSCSTNGDIEKIADDVIKKADEAMYKAKELGRDRFILFDEIK